MARNLTDAQARWEAVVLIDAAVRDAIHGGAVVSWGEDHGWTESDQLAVEQHAWARVDGLISRQGKAKRRSRRSA